jgi:hypothetical protein
MGPNTGIKRRWATPQFYTRGVKSDNMFDRCIAYMLSRVSREQTIFSQDSDLLEYSANGLFKTTSIAKIVDQFVSGAHNNLIASQVKSEDVAIQVGETPHGGWRIRRIDVVKIAQQKLGGRLGNGK